MTNVGINYNIMFTATHLQVLVHPCSYFLNTSLHDFIPGDHSVLLVYRTCVHHNFFNRPPNAGRMSFQVFQNPDPCCGSSYVRGVFFSSKSHSLLRMIGGGGNGPGYFLKTQAKSPTETANYKVTTIHS